MPQMSPMLWFSLYMYFLLLFMLMIIMMYYIMIYYNIIMKKEIKFMLNNYKMKW